MSGPMGPGADGEELIEVRLLGVPLGIRQKALEHMDEVLREMQLLVTGGTEDDITVPARLARLHSRFPPSYRRMADDVRRLLDEAVAAEQPSVDVTYLVVREIA